LHGLKKQQSGCGLGSVKGFSTASLGNKKEIISMLPFPLYHGTSTLFLGSIIKNGLGGGNPIEELDILSFAQDLLPIAQKVLGHEDDFMHKVGIYERMTNQTQTAGNFNYQHGDTYLSPSIETASRYACNSRYGSEIITYSLDLLEEIIRRNIAGVKCDLYEKYRSIFSLLDMSPAPILIKVECAKENVLLDEHGKCPKEQIMELINYKEQGKSLFDALGQQMNFRLKNAIEIEDCEIFLLSVLEYNQISPKFDAYPISKKSYNLHV
jgi:hypothetical protein